MFAGLVRARANRTIGWAIDDCVCIPITRRKSPCIAAVAETSADSSPYRAAITRPSAWFARRMHGYFASFSGGAPADAYPKYGQRTIGAVAGSSTSSQRLLRIAAVPTAVFLVFAVSFATGWGGATAISALRVAGSLGFPAFAAVSAAVAARRGRGRQRQAWLVMAFGLVALEFGAVTV